MRRYVRTSLNFQAYSKGLYWHTFLPFHRLARWTDTNYRGKLHLYQVRYKTSKSVILYARYLRIMLGGRYTWNSKLCIIFVNLMTNELLLRLSYICNCTEHCYKHPERAYERSAFWFLSRIGISFLLIYYSCVRCHYGVICLIISLINCTQQLFLTNNFIITSYSFSTIS